MKICLYLEYRHFAKGLLFKNVGTGLLTSYENQKRILALLRIPYTEQWDNSCDILQINTPWLKSIYLMKKAKRQGKKVVVWSHVTVEDAMQVFRFAPLIKPLLKKYLTYAYGLADIVFCPTSYTKSLLVAYGLPEQKLVAVSNGVDTTRFVVDHQRRQTAREQYKLTKLTIGTVALVIPRKGIDTFLELAARFPDYQFIWYGKIYSKLVAKSLPKTLPPNVTFSGYVDDIVAAMNSIDIFIFPSYEENQGMVILEAAAVGLPVLVRDLPAYRDWLYDNDNCLKAQNTDDFEARINQLAKSEPLRQQLSQRALALSQKESITVIAERTKKLYEQLLKQR